MTTITAWAIPTDMLLIYWLWRATETWSQDDKSLALALLSSWMFLSKWIKLVGHYIRYPVDVVFLPVSITFGYVHGLLKLWALFTLDVVSGSPSLPCSPCALNDHFDPTIWRQARRSSLLDECPARSFNVPWLPSNAKSLQ